MYWFDLIGVVFGLTTLVVVCLLPSDRMTKDLSREVWHRKDYIWGGLLIVLLTVAWISVHLSSDVRYGRLTMVGLVGPMLWIATVGVYAGRSIEAGRRFGREAPYSAEDNSVTPENDSITS